MRTGVCVGSGIGSTEEIATASSILEKEVRYFNLFDLLILGINVLNFEFVFSMTDLRLTAMYQNIHAQFINIYIFH